MRSNKLAQRCRAVLMVMLVFLAMGALLAVLDYEKPPRHVQAVTDTAQPNTDENQCAQDDQPSLEYHVWRVFPPGRGGYALAIVSVSPRHFNRADMTALAAQLNREFAQETRLRAVLFDDESIPRNFLAGGVEISTLYERERGRYYLDRTACREYIQFSTRRERPRRTIRLNCSRQQRR